jgi:transposase
MLALVSVESRIPPDHPLRAVKALADSALRELDPLFDEMYATVGRDSVPPERLLKGSLLMALYSIRSERQLCEQLGFNMLYAWFLDMNMTDEAFDHSTFSKNRDRLLEHDVARRFFDVVVDKARAAGLLSPEHFSVDGTLIEAWGSAKSFRPKDDDSADNNGFGDFRNTTRTNDTHESKTDPDSRLFKKGNGREAKLSYMGHALMENRHGLLADFEVTEASGRAERQAALDMLDRERERRDRRKKKAKRKQTEASRRRNKKARTMTLAADKGYDTRDFVHACRERHVTPHVARNQHRFHPSALDGRTTRHSGYRASSRARLLIEKIFGWMKTIGGFRRSRFRGYQRTRAASLFVASAFNLLRISKLLPAAA